MSGNWLLDGNVMLRVTMLLLHFIWQGCAVALIAMGADWLLRRGSAHARYLIHVAALLTMVGCLPVTLALVSVPRPESAATSIKRTGNVAAPADGYGRRETTIASADRDGLPGVEEGGVLSGAFEKTSLASSAEARGAAPVQAKWEWPLLAIRLEPIAPYATTLYLTGVVLMLLRLLRALWSAQRLRRTSISVQDARLLEMLRDQAGRKGLRAAPLVAWCERISVPLVVGIIEPLILLPASLASGLTPQQLEALLAHELAHIRRGDLVVNLLQRLVESLLFFHPAVWYISRRVSAERENACDDDVLSLGWGRVQYAEALLQIAERISGSGPGALLRDAGSGATSLGAAGGNASQFKRRLLRLLGHEPVPRTRLVPGGIGLGLAAIIALLVAPLLVTGQAQPRVSSESNAAAEKPEGHNSVKKKESRESSGLSGAVRTPADVIAERAPGEQHTASTIGPGEARNGPSERPGEQGEPEAAFGEQGETVRVVAGRVVDTAGSPIAGTRLCLPLSTEPTGRIVSGESDLQGRFCLEVPTTWLPERKIRRLWALWVYAPKHQLAVARADESLYKPSEAKDLEIVLGPATDTAFVVLDPQGKPVAGALVEPARFRAPGSYQPVPSSWLSWLGAKTDASGRALLPAMPREGFFRVRVTTDGFGTQQLRLTDRGSEPAERTIRLREVGRLEGRIVADRPDWIRGVTLLLETGTEFELENRTQGVIAIASRSDLTFDGPSVAPDQDGKFVVPAIAAGRISIWVTVDQAMPVRPRLPDRWLEVQAGVSTHLEVLQLPAVLVEGHIRARYTGQPIAGVDISVHSVEDGGVNSDSVVSDAAGKFTARRLPGPVETQIIYLPGRYARISEPEESRVTVPPDVTRFELPAIEVDPVVEVPGRLVDKDGHHVPGARLVLIAGNHVYPRCTTDDEGRFTLVVPKSIALQAFEVRLRGDEEKTLIPKVEQQTPLLLRLDTVEWPSGGKRSGPAIPQRPFDQRRALDGNEATGKADARDYLSDKEHSGDPATSRREDPPTIALRGKRPVVGATVYVAGYGGTSDVGVATSDENGRFAIPDMTPWQSDIIMTANGPRPTVSRTLVVEHRDFGRRACRFHACPATIDVELAEPSVVEGLVTDAAGHPKPAVQVAAKAAETEQEKASAGATAITDGQGRYRLLLQGIQAIDLYVWDREFVSTRIKSFPVVPGKTHQAAILRARPRAHWADE